MGRHGIPCVGIDTGVLTLGSLSRYCTATETCRSDDDLLSLLTSLGQAGNHKNLILCESDMYVLFVDRFRSDLEQYFHLGFSAQSSVRDMINKKSMVKLAHEAGLATPATFSFPEISADNLKELVPFPAIIKPPFTQSHYRTKGVIVNDGKGLLNALKHERFREGCIIQEIIPGDETHLWTCMGYCGGSAVPLALVTGHKLRQRPRDYGLATLAVSRDNPIVKAFTTSFLHHLHYVGCFELEFKENASKEYVFIEANPRICSLNELAVASGVDLPSLAYCMTYDIRPDHVVQQKDGIHWIDVIKDLDTCLRYYRRSGKGSLRDWADRSVRSDAHAVFDRHDLKPFVLDAGRFLAKTVGEFIGLQKAMRE
jgi:predicted ATP-grasp superfamily ATP-dependent carboligase